MKTDNKTSATSEEMIDAHPGERIDQPPSGDPIPVRDPSAPPAAEKKTADEWARAKGMLHEFTDGKRSANARPKAPAPKVHNPKFVHYHRARHSHGWARNEELTEAQFDAAITTADSHVYR